MPVKQELLVLESPNKSSSAVYFYDWLDPDNLQEIGSPFDDDSFVEKSHKYVFEIYERLLPQLAEKLNKFHNEKLSSNYWEIVIGYWLIDYIYKFYDRYITLKFHLENNINLKFEVLAEKSFQIVETGHDYEIYSRGSFLNLQIISKIIKLAFRDKIAGTIESDEVLEKRSDFYTVNCSGIKKHLSKLTSKTLLICPYFDNSILKLVQVKSLGKIISLNPVKLELKSVQADLNKRRTLLSDFKVSDDFEQILAKEMFGEIPLCYLEMRHTLIDEIDKNFPKSMKRIFSANQWEFNEVFKLWAAEFKERGGALLGHQHGGTYGMQEYHPQEVYETKILDTFYTWGWEKNKKNIKSFYASKIKKLKSTEKNKVLYCTTMYNYYPRYFESYKFPAYIERQKSFLTSLSSDIYSSLLLRFYPNDTGWKNKEKILNSFADINQSTEPDFYNELSSSSLFISDHSSTTFLESIANGIPTLLFWPDNEYILHEDAKALFNKLKSVNILHSDPFSAAQFLNNNFPNKIKEWWLSSEVKRVREEFCNTYARTSKGLASKWITELKI